MNIQEYELMNILADERYKNQENCLKKQDTLWEKSTVR